MERHLNVESSWLQWLLSQLIPVIAAQPDLTGFSSPFRVPCRAERIWPCVLHVECIRGRAGRTPGRGVSLYWQLLHSLGRADR